MDGVGKTHSFLVFASTIVSSEVNPRLDINVRNMKSMCSSSPGAYVGVSTVGPMAWCFALALVHIQHMHLCWWNCFEKRVGRP